jgi:hypothetical protein
MQTFLKIRGSDTEVKSPWPLHQVIARMDRGALVLIEFNSGATAFATPWAITYLYEEDAA